MLVDRSVTRNNEIVFESLYDGVIALTGFEGT